ncbi:unnamed protein product, partial [Sphenostylis stenocarpa]
FCSMKDWSRLNMNMILDCLVRQWFHLSLNILMFGSRSLLSVWIGWTGFGNQWRVTRFVTL